MLAPTALSRVQNAAIAWSLLAFGGVYPWALAPVVLAAAFLLGGVRPRLLVRENRAIDGAMLASLAVIALQLVPWPRGLMAVVAPATVRTWDGLALQRHSLLPVSAWPLGTLEALAVAFAAVAVFWSARDLFHVHGIRRAIRTVALVGALASFAGLLQRKAGTPLVYGFWRPLETGAWPFGPFVNRNFFATWVLMAIPLCTGYLLARHPGRVSGDVRPWRVRAAHALDGRGVWLVTAVALMTIGLFASLSRSGAIGFAAVLVTGWAGAQLRPGSRQRRIAAGAVLIVSAAVLLWGDVGTLVTRFENTHALDPRERQAIWRDTVPLIRDHWLTGTGSGAYERAMLLYQQTDRTYYDNQAHNQYLQVLADGGLMLAIPALVALIALVVQGVRRLREDRTGMFWIRLGAAAGLAGVAVQGFWETGLRAPGNAILSAVIAAILLHEPPATGQAHRTTP